ncbi:hypothetical protein [Desulforhopalus sp. 52FAK]
MLKNMSIITLFLVFICSGCDLTRPHVINLYLPGNDDSNRTNEKIVELPVCYLENCEDNGNGNCSELAFQSVSESTASAWQLFASKPNMIFAVGQQDFYVQVERASDMQEVASKWSEIGCVPNKGVARTNARYRECVRHMPEWVSVANSEENTILDLNRYSDYRRICLRMTKYD